MSKDYVEYLRHILAECEYITSVITTDFSKDHFLTDETLKRAIVRSLEIVGEATKQIPIDVKLRWNGIAWKNMAGMRDRLIHDYMGVNYHIVWDVAKNVIPVVKEQIAKIISEST